jgi:LemA protein
MKHERETLEAVIQARNQAVSAERAAAANPGNPAAMQGLVGAEGVLSGVLTKFFVLAEGYPDLKASANMLAVQEELASTENRVAFARQAYNDTVMQYNQARASVPTNLVATAFRFEPADFFEVEDAGEREAPKISFG